MQGRIPTYLGPGDRVSNVTNALAENTRSCRLMYINELKSCKQHFNRTEPVPRQEVGTLHSWDTCRQSRRLGREWLPQPGLRVNVYLGITFIFVDKIVLKQTQCIYYSPEAGLWLCWVALLLLPARIVRCAPDPRVDTIKKEQEPCEQDHQKPFPPWSFYLHCLLWPLLLD